MRLGQNEGRCRLTQSCRSTREVERQVLSEQQRLAVQPGLAAVPALDRWWMEDILAQVFQHACQVYASRLRANLRFQCPRNAEHVIDGWLYSRPIRLLAEEEIRSQHRLDDFAEVVI